MAENLRRPLRGRISRYFLARHASKKKNILTANLNAYGSYDKRIGDKLL